jgi:hypothetical protein
MKILCLVGLLLSVPAVAEEVTRDPVRKEMRWLVDRSDELLGGDRTDDNRSKSTLRLQATDHVSHDHPSDPKFHAHFNAKLGVIERWQREANQWFRDLYIGWFDKIKDKLKHEAAKIQTDASGSGGEAAKSAPLPPEKDPWRFSLDKHVTVSRHPEFRAHAQARKDYESRYVLNSLAFTGGWSWHHRWQMSASHAISGHLFSSWTWSFGNQASWSINDKKFGTSHGPSLSYLISSTQVLNFAAGVSTSLDKSNWSAQGYSISAVYRQQAFKEWLFLEVNSSLNFAREQHFGGDPGVGGKVEVVF